MINESILKKEEKKSIIEKAHFIETHSIEILRLIDNNENFIENLLNFLLFEKEENSFISFSYIEYDQKRKTFKK